MGYNNNLPIGYQQFYPYPNYQPVNNQNVQQNNQVQNGGFVRVQNEAEARNYLVALGTSVTFRDENAPYIYTKTMGFSQLDNPVFEKFKLVKEDEPEPMKTAEYVLKEDFDKIKNEIEALKARLEKPKGGLLNEPD